MSKLPRFRIRPRDVVWQRVVLFSLRRALETPDNCIFFRDANGNGVKAGSSTRIFIYHDGFDRVANSSYGLIAVNDFSFPVFFSL